MFYFPGHPCRIAARCSAVVSHEKQAPMMSSLLRSVLVLRLRLFVSEFSLLLPPLGAALVWLRERWPLTHPRGDVPPLSSGRLATLFYHTHVKFIKPLKARDLQFFGPRHTHTRTLTPTQHAHTLVHP